jgi:glycosyltransferase involved in cell wall biosynthesis
MKESNSLPLISVIVTTKNERNYLEDCLASIKKQNFPQQSIEIIVVDNNSIDGTQEIAKKFTDKVFNKGPERSSQRNFGIMQANGKYILYLDADMTLSRDVIKTCAEKCETEGYVGLYTPERIKGKGFWIKVRDFERSFYNASCIDAVRFIKREEALKIGGFDESITGPEDWDFDRRLKSMGKTTLIDTLIFHNENGFSLKKYLNKKNYYMKDFNRYVEKWGVADPIIKKQLGFRYRIFVVFFENNKWKKLIMHPFLAFGMYFLKGCIGINYLILKHRKKFY